MIERQGITLVGVPLTNLEDDGAVQLALPFERAARGALDAAIDDVRDRFGIRRRSRARVLRGPRPGHLGPAAARLRGRPGHAEPALAAAIRPVTRCRWPGSRRCPWWCSCG